MFSKTEQDLFYLAVLLIIVAYFVGFSTDARTLGAVAVSVGNTFTGRDSSGQFANYPH